MDLYIVGGITEYFIPDRADSLAFEEWGNTNGNNSGLIALGDTDTFWGGTRVTYRTTFYFENGGNEGVAIVGGKQTLWPFDMSTSAEGFVWGEVTDDTLIVGTSVSDLGNNLFINERGIPSGGPAEPPVMGLAFHEPWGRGVGTIQLYTRPAGSPNFAGIGGWQERVDNNGLWPTDSWGDLHGPEAVVGNGQWHNQFGVGPSLISLSFTGVHEQQGVLNAICVWDQPDGKGNMSCFTSRGNTNLADYPRDPANPALGSWDHAVRSYKANNTTGSFAGGNPVRHEEFGPNYNVVNAGLHAQVATRIYITWVGADVFIQSGSIVSGIGADIRPMCMDLAGNTANGTPIQLWEHGQPAPPNQKWHYDSNGGAIVHVASVKCVQAGGDGTQNGQLLELWDRTGADNQIWGFDRQLNKWYNPHGKCIEVPGGAAINGVRLRIWDQISGSLNQIWRNYSY